MRLIVLLALVLVIGTAAASAQTAAPATPAQQPTPATPPPAQAPNKALEPTGFTYDPQGRRDPFVSLVRRGTEVSGLTPNAGPRPSGLAGFTTDEISVRGIVRSRDGFIAMLQATDNKTYLAKSGDKLLDGAIRTITADTVVILQRVNDPLALESEREVRKVLRKTEEAK